MVVDFSDFKCQIEGERDAEKFSKLGINQIEFKIGTY